MLNGLDPMARGCVFPLPVATYDNDKNDGKYRQQGNQGSYDDSDYLIIQVLLLLLGGVLVVDAWRLLTGGY